MGDAPQVIPVLLQQGLIQTELLVIGGDDFFEIRWSEAAHPRKFGETLAKRIAG